ncbi:MAG: transposase, partial [Deltaproteobacteria bacterium]|nr:transposase [Deltaproteobacteria bacterium]
FDITSFSSYAKELEFLEWGYNRDKERLPQINFGVIYGEPSSLPLFYTRYPGSIPDVRTLYNMVEYLEWLELSKILFVLDRDFFSSYNLKKMNTDMRFIIAMPYSNKNFQINKKIIYGVRNRIEIGEKRYYSYLYLDEKRRVEERERFLSRILEIEKKVEEPELCKNREDLKEFLSENVRGWEKIFEIVEHDGASKIKRKEKGINSQLEKMGTMILLSNKMLDGKDVLRLYKRKDVVEKFFDNMKHDIERKRLRIHSQETFEGRLFLDFLALIIYSRISSVMRKEGINKDLTVQELMYEFKKIKLIRLGAKKTIVTEVSKKQRELFQSFKIPQPTRP